MDRPLRLGSRVSPLAMAQARQVQAMLVSLVAREDTLFPISGFTTTGDRILDRPLVEAGGKGLFTKELDAALLGGQIDAAVHSMKDLPTRLPEGLTLAAVPAREDARDVFIARSGGALRDLPAGAVIGTASVRRQAQTLFRRPDLRITTLRGSVETRLKRVEEGAVDATYLALAGLKRLNLAHLAQTIIALADMPSAAGQGALAIVCRSDDAEARRMLSALNREEDWLATSAERAFLDVLDGSCRTPIGAHAWIEAGRLLMTGELLSPDGTQRWRRSGEVTLGADARRDAESLGRRLGEEVKRAASA